jgi:hypothetical protein
MNPFTLIRLFGQPEFQQGLVVGGVAALALLLVRAPGWLLTWGVAAFAALAWTERLSTEIETPSWTLPVAVVVAIAGSWAVRTLLRRAPGWSVGVVFALWVLGVWGTVPDTERAVVTMGVVAGLLPALWPKLRVPVRWPGAFVAIAALGFVTATDGAARTSAMIGAFGMVGMPVAAAAALATRRNLRLSPWALVAAQVLHVIVSGRVAGQWSSAAGAVAIAALSALATGVGLVLVQGSQRFARAKDDQPSPPASGRTPLMGPLTRGHRASRNTVSGGEPPGQAPSPSDRSSSQTPLLRGFYRPPKKR